ncbi:peptidoglycan editing factor PgeF [Psychromonas sp. RZ22]|uniref:peptidoglycan editing factor PgeF n=1 Tax=Psychromonas algarum TaxID=2555643 RepID=UPI0010675A2F|nr:peptidoglycan editing factor PgeF [Psychromonas sp. RZ22]TEW56777.1 peptidoglycan editing factor PgeF [Psychromonas sp. RZ22]
MQLIKPNWAAPTHIHAYSTTRLGGVSEGEFAGLNLGMHVADNLSHVLENRLLLAEQFSDAPDFCWLNQTHSCDLIKLSSKTPQATNGDASWINSKQRTCVVMTADCLPVLVTDQQGSFVAAIHAGWRGLCDGIIEKSINHICTELAINTSELLVWLGPCIGLNAFEIGDEVRNEFIAQDAKAADAFVAHNNKWLADLHQLAKLRLTAFNGVTITENNSCTFTDPELFYSYRRDGKTGRLATFIWIE